MACEYAKPAKVGCYNVIECTININDTIVISPIPSCLYNYPNQEDCAIIKESQETT